MNRREFLKNLGTFGLLAATNTPIEIISRVAHLKEPGLTWGWYSDFQKDIHYKACGYWVAKYKTGFVPSSKVDYSSILIDRKYLKRYKTP